MNIRRALAAGSQQNDEETKVAKPELPPGIRCGSDFSWMLVGTELFHFKTGNQRETVRVLFEESEMAGFAEGCGLTERAIADKIGASDTNFTIRHTFRGNPAKGSLIKRIGKGQWALSFRWWAEESL